MKLLSFFLSIFVALTSVWSAEKSTGIKIGNLKGADLSLMNNHDPEVERQNLDLLPGYEINLFASEPMFANPIHMVWDSRGRLWVACSWSYPQLKPGDTPNDKIVILEDTDGDGRADKSTVFAEGLYMPTGIELIDGGVMVAQTPDILLLRDTDGDDIADQREIALTGFGIEDSHHSASAWRRGPGGWIYFQEGIFLHTQVETQYGMVYNYNGGVYQYNPRTQKLNVFAKVGVGNPWGHVFDKWGQSFMVDNPRVNYLSPATGNSGEKININKLIQTEKQCGGDLVTGSHMPEELQGQLLSGRFKSRTVIRYEFVEDGAGFGAYVKEPLVASRHPNFRPVDVKIGPDGAVYVADWYNSIINHANHNFRDARRDHSHGRIWRITAKDRPLVKKPKLVGETIPTLLNHLKSPEAWTRHQSRFELGKADPDQVLAQTEKWVDSLSSTDPEYAHHLVEAMWTCQNVERVSEKVLKKVLASESGHARSAGARVIRYWHEQLSDPIAMIAKLCSDDFPRVRMEAVLSAGYIPKAESYVAILNTLDFESDKFLDTAFPQSVKALEPYWRPALEAGSLSFSKPEHKAYAEKSAGLGFDKRLKEFIALKNPKANELNDMKHEFGRMANLQDFNVAIHAILNPKTDGKVSYTLLEGMLRNRLLVNQKALKTLSRLKKALDHHHSDIVVATSQVLGKFQVVPSVTKLMSLVIDENRSMQIRKQAAIAMGMMDNSNSLGELRKLAKAENVELRGLATFGLIQADVFFAANAISDLFAQDDQTFDSIALIREMSKKRNGTKTLAEALAKVSIQENVKSKVIEYHRQSGFLDKNLIKLFESKVKGSLSDRLVAENRKKLSQDIDQLGDPRRGEEIYRRKSMACTSCHSIGSAGPVIGPNLVAVGSAAPTNYIVEAILEPNRSIAEHYENMMFVMSDDSIRMGVITFKGENEISFKDASQGGKVVTVSKDEIKSQKVQPSLMPSGLVNQLKDRQEFLDLAKFVSMLGKPGPYANDESPVIRKWRVASGGGEASNLNWMPAYSLVDGKLPSKEVQGQGDYFAEGYVQVQVPGEIALKLNHTKGVSLKIDGKEVKDLGSPIMMKKGRRTLTFSIDETLREKEGLRVELEEVKGSKARFTPEGGI